MPGPPAPQGWQIAPLPLGAVEARKPPMWGGQGVPDSRVDVPGRQAVLSSGEVRDEAPRLRAVDSTALGLRARGCPQFCPLCTGAVRCPA